MSGGAGAAAPSRSKRLNQLRKAHAQSLTNWEQLLTGTLSVDVFRRAFCGRDDGEVRKGYADAEDIVTGGASRGILQLAVEREFRSLVADVPEAAAPLVSDLVKAFRTATAVREAGGGAACGTGCVVRLLKTPLLYAQAEFEAVLTERHIVEKLEELERLEEERASGLDGRCGCVGACGVPPARQSLQRRHRHPSGCRPPSRPLAQPTRSAAQKQK